MKRIVSGVALGAMVTVGAAFAASHGGDEKTVKARQGLMKLYAHNLTILGGMAQGKIDYDSARAAAAAKNLAALANMDQTTLWAPDTDLFSVAGSNAKPELWDNLPDALAKVGALRAAATDMAAVAGDGLDALRGAIGPVGQACGACHKAYREKAQ